VLRTHLSATLLATTLVVSCCSGGTGSRQESADARSRSGTSVPSAYTIPVTPSDHPVGMEWRDEELDLDAVHDVDRRTYAEYQRRVAGCMSRAGFEYIQVKFVDERSGYYRAINPLRMETANEFGYHPPPVASGSDPNRHVDGFDLALDGTDEHPGCAPRAFKTVHDVVDPMFHDAQAVLNSLDAAVDGFFASAAGQSKLASWRDCMASVGYDQFESPEDAARHFLDGDITDRERRVRAADLHCDQDVRLTEERSRWERERFTVWQDSNSVALSALRDRVREASAALALLESQLL
jgi:hypothetical protein